MSGLNLDRDVALRIALASRTLPDIELPTLLGVLIDRLGDPLSLDTLSKITVTDLKTGLGSLGGEEDDEDIGIGLEPMKLAVRILWGDTEEDDGIPIPQKDLSPPERSIRVAIASNSGANLDGHFGSCLRFLIYDVSDSIIQLCDVRSAAEADFADDKNAWRANLIKDCQVVYVVSVGGPTAAKIIRAGVYPIKKIEGGLANDVIVDLQTVMQGTPPPWLAKILGVEQSQRLKNYRGVEDDT